MSGLTLKHRAEYLLFVVFAGVVNLLPERLATGVGSGLGWLTGSLLRIRRATVEENLERAFPESSRTQRRRIARRAYRHLGREAVAFIRFGKMSPEDFRSRAEVDGLEFLADPVARGQGVIVLLGHIGNWEIAGAGVTARGVPVSAVAKRQRNRLFDAYVRKVRARYGMGVVLTSDGPRAILERLRVPEAVAMVADQNATRGGVFVDFFGVPASTARGPGVLAVRRDVPVVFAEPVRLPGHRARYRVTLRPLEYDRGESLEATVESLAQAYMSAMEGAVRRHPEQYFWFHRRWKTRPAERRPEPGDAPQVEGRASRSTATDTTPIGESA